MLTNNLDDTWEELNQYHIKVYERGFGSIKAVVNWVWNNRRRRKKLKWIDPQNVNHFKEERMEGEELYKYYYIK
jgi:hypothetical protein